MSYWKRINIRASDYRFEDKIKYYLGFTNSRNQKREGTKIKELEDLAKTVDDFKEIDIEQRYAKIISSFIQFMDSNKLLKKV